LSRSLSLLLSPHKTKSRTALWLSVLLPPNCPPRDLYARTAGGERAELIFIDPPYDNIEANLARIFAKADELASPDARVILELPGNLNPEIAGWKIVRRFGRPKRDTPNAAIFERS